MKSTTNFSHADPDGKIANAPVRDWLGSENLPSIEKTADDRIPCGDVHVWRAPLNRSTKSIELLERTLARDELCRADRYRFEADRRHFIVGRGLLRDILSHYLKLPAEQLRFRYSSRGKPLLEYEFDQGLCFNVSHSHELVIYGITRGRRIGVDLEYVRPLADMETLARRCFSEQEYAEFSSVPDDSKQQAFFACWTRKESYVKAIGDGLTAALGDFDVSVRPDRPAAILAVRPDPGEAAQWSLETLNIGEGYFGTLAVEGRDGYFC